MLHYHFLRAWATSKAGYHGRDSERGSATTENVITIAIMAGLAISVGAIIVTAVLAKARGITLD